MDTKEKVGLFNAITRWAGGSHACSMLRDKISREIHRMDRLAKYENYSKNIHENCTYCRKKCKLFKTNECFKKSSEEQLKCKYYKGS